MNTKVVLVARILLGVGFFLFGLNGFFQFMPMPKMDPAGQQFMGALMESGYFMPFLKTIETLSGLLILTGVFVPLALTFLAPILINIFFFHLFLDPANIAVPIVLMIFEIFLAYAYRDSFKGVLDPNARPS